MNPNKLVEEEIEKLKGSRPEVGSVVAHESEELSMELLRYEEDVAFCLHFPERSERSFPADEIFDVNELKRVCIRREVEGVKAFIGKIS